uniref:RNA polymerase alpha subunit n=1 Tax=Bignonia magnifica TaxID=354051 RepID=UPI001FCDA4FE|nr:RNA polymerase alpha subunit [Bignonia magnifica]YP_010334466.1 RNA polymerase alpha subunit [Bignonia magnifica]UNH90360.1 RNA polymerase alpha subunit [Bignonia magnifica]UNH90361.1 RNA polymerase alpha subunit [Bignonia magnifica]
MASGNVVVSNWKVQWKCIELRIHNGHLQYGRFCMAPLLEGQADLIGMALRKTLLGELEATCITCAKFQDIPHEYLNIWGVEESIYDIVMNLNKIVLRKSESFRDVPRAHQGRIRAQGPMHVTAANIHFFSSDVEIIDRTQHIAKLTKPTSLSIELEIDTRRPLSERMPYTLQEGSYPINATFSPILNANYSIHSYRHKNEKEEILFLEIWTNGSLTPVEALNRASQRLSQLLKAPLSIVQEKENQFSNEEHIVSILSLTLEDRWETLRKTKASPALKCISLDQLQFSSKIYNCLQKGSVWSLLDLVNRSYKDLMKIEYFCLEDVRGIILIVEKFFQIYLR